MDSFTGMGNRHCLSDGDLSDTQVLKVTL